MTEFNQLDEIERQRASERHGGAATAFLPRSLTLNGMDDEHVVYSLLDDKLQPVRSPMDCRCAGGGVGVAGSLSQLVDDDLATVCRPAGFALQHCGWVSAHLGGRIRCSEP